MRVKFEYNIYKDGEFIGKQVRYIKPQYADGMACIIEGFGKSLCNYYKNNYNVVQTKSENGLVYNLYFETIKENWYESNI